MNEFNNPIRLTLVIPCYNESDRIGLMFNGLNSFISQWKDFLEIIIVNDGSKDNTESLLKQHEVFKNHSKIISIVSQSNTGKGGALKNGVMRAKGDYILTLDADMATPPSELIKWIGLWGNVPAANTIYIGSREHVDSVITKKGNRKVAGNIFNFIVRIISPLKMRDTQCGFKLYPALTGKRIFSTLHTYGWAHDVEILYKAYLDKVDIIEMPIEWNAVDGSKINVLKDGLNMLLEILAIVVKTKLSYKPLKDK